MIDRATAIDAELFRRRHCDSPEREHQCLGKITISPGLCRFDCPKCGEETVKLADAMDVLDANALPARNNLATARAGGKLRS